MKSSQHVFDVFGKDIAMICKNCGKETGGKRACTACGYDPAKDDPLVEKTAKPLSAEITLPPIEIVKRKKANVPAIIGFIFAILVYIPIPFVGSITSPAFCFLAFILSLVGFVIARNCGSGRILSIVALILCILAVLLIVTFFVLIIALSGWATLMEMGALNGLNA